MTGYNEAFIIDNETKEKLIKEDPKSADLIKPVLRGKDILKYGHTWETAEKPWLIATFPSRKLSIDHYPAIKKHLLSFGKERLEQSGRIFDGIKSRKKTAYAWYELQDTCAYHAEFKKEKIVWKRIGSILRFAYCVEPVFSLDSTCIATGEKMQFLTALLNSRLALYKLFSYAPKTGTGDLIISVQAVAPLPLPHPNKKQEEEIVGIFRAILKAKTSNPYADISDMESEIDHLTYKLI